MDVPKVKYFGGKIVPRWDLRVRTTLGGPWTKDKIYVRNKDIKLGTWNVLSLYRPGAFQCTVNEIVKYKIDVVAVQEVK